jgi:class I lanthipeptide synthase
MKKNNPYKNFPSFVLRSPLYPFNFIQSLTSGQNTSEEQLMEVCRNPVVEEALFLASPDLHQQMKERLAGNLTDSKKVERLHNALMRYILRMCTRPTPFGLFAGFCVGKWDKESDIQLPPQEDYSRHTRLDMNYLCALAQDLANQPEIKAQIKYYPNSSIYPVGEQLRYVEYRYKNTRRTHHIVAVDRSEYLERVLEVATKGAYLVDLAKLLEDKENDISMEEATDFIDELIDSQLLVNELEPAITGPEFLDQILAVLKNIPGIESTRDTILKAKQMLQTVDDSKIGSTVSSYHQIAKHLEPLGTKYELKFLFQTDMVKPVSPEHCKLEWSYARDVLNGMEVFNRLTLKPANNNMDRFREAFFERYETKEVPLLQALDTESGVGYLQTGGSGDIAPLVDDLAIPGTGSNSQDISWNPVQAFLFKKYRDALAKDSYEVIITDKDVEGFESKWDDLPDTLASMVQIVKDKDEKDPASRPLLSFSGLGGSSAGNLLGRFCHADEATDAFVREITAKEAELNPDVILPEIIHLPESRVGNVMLRPVLRDYEIAYLAKPAVAEEFQIKLEDLMLSVKGNRVMLRSKRLKKWIFPHLTNAHNFSYNALPIYQFLADFQTQDLRSAVGFNWGAFTNEYEFLPRVSYQNLIFSPATWNIKKDDIEKLVKIKDEEKLLAEMRSWRESRKMPAHVLLADNDNKLFINLDNLLCIKTLFSVTKNRGNFQLQESLYDFGPDHDNGLVKNKEGVFTNEFVFCFFNSDKKQMDTRQTEAAKNGKKQS